MDEKDEQVYTTKVHLVVLGIIDHDHVGAEEVRAVLESAHYPNWCISPDVKFVKTVDIGTWEDGNPLNDGRTEKAEWEKLFPLLKELE
ncbi:MAG: hypothetical protein IPL28_26260 [Chloroflexi bacterium]|nr:hypothetical protein [Chloroflexota bacterium]